MILFFAAAIHDQPLSIPLEYVLQPRNFDVSFPTTYEGIPAELSLERILSVFAGLEAMMRLPSLRETIGSILKWSHSARLSSLTGIDSKLTIMPRSDALASSINPAITPPSVASCIAVTPSRLTPIDEAVKASLTVLVFPR